MDDLAISLVFGSGVILLTFGIFRTLNGLGTSDENLTTLGTRLIIAGSALLLLVSKL